MSAGWRGSAGQVRRNFRLEFFSLQSSPHRTTGNFLFTCRLRRQPRHFFLGRIHLGAGLAGGFYAGQVARRGGFYAGQARQGGYARQAPSRRTLTGPCYTCYMCYISQGKPLNIHSPRIPCYMCYMCYISQSKPPNIHSPPGPCYMCYMCYISQGKPLNIHSPRVPCYMCYMCYMV